MIKLLLQSRCLTLEADYKNKVNDIVEKIEKNLRKDKELYEVVDENKSIVPEVFEKIIKDYERSLNASRIFTIQIYHLGLNLRIREIDALT